MTSFLPYSFFYNGDSENSKIFQNSVQLETIYSSSSLYSRMHNKNPVSK